MTTNPHYNQDLPIYPYKDELVQAMSQFQVLVVVGDTGSGKTTQIPQYALEIDGINRIAVTQPRRIAAISAATRVSQEMRTSLGDRVGYSIRFEKCLSSDTNIAYMTDGVLLRNCTTDPNLNGYDLVILDEAHERSLETDILIGLLRRTLQRRPTLKLIIMSATLDIEKFSEFFGDCPVFSVPGRMYAVDILWQKKMKMAVLKSSFVQRSVETVFHIHKNESSGDILVFLTGQQDIETAIRKVNELHAELDYRTSVSSPEVKDLIAYPIYSSLDSIEQKSIFLPARAGTRKVIFATNIAQTSITVPGIKYVVDSGFVKQRMYDPKTHMDALLIVPISQAAATQRAGRAGRTENGKVYRLYSRDAFDNMAPETTPEIQRTSLLSTILYLKKIGIHDVFNFDFIDPPDPEMVMSAVKELFLLSAVDDHARLTSLGRMMAEFPVSPFLSRALISACQDFDCVEEVLTICAMLSCEDVFLSPRSKEKQIRADDARTRFFDKTGDHMTLLNVYDAWREHDYQPSFCRDHFLHYRVLKQAKQIKRQLRDTLEKVKLLRKHHHTNEHKTSKNRNVPYSVLSALCTGFYVHAAKAHPQRNYFFPYLNATARSTSSTSLISLFIHPQSSLASHQNDYSGRNAFDWVIYNDIQYVSCANMRIVSRIDYKMIEILLKRHELLDEHKLLHVTTSATENHVLSLEGEAQDTTTGEIDDVLPFTANQFEKVREVLDEQHHQETPLDSMGVVAISTQGDLPMTSYVSISKCSHGQDEDESKKRKREEARLRYLQRKKR